jgi:hypothetical protein
MQSRLRELEALPVGHPLVVRSTSSTDRYIPPGPARSLAVEEDRERALAPVRADYDAAKNELERLTAHLDQLKARRSALPQRLLEWGAELPANRIQPFAGPQPKLPKAPDRKAVDQLRAHIVELQAALQRVRTAPFPAAHAKEIIRQHVDHLASRAVPDVLRVLELGRPPGFAQTQLRPHAASAFPAPDGVGLIAWLFRDQLVQKLNTEIDSIADDEDALSPEQRTSQERRISDEILEIERAEEMTIEALEADNIEILRRDNADPRAILSLTLDLPGPH